MANITQHYGIAGRVEFLDVELSKDNQLFLDPHAVRLQNGRFAAQANRCTTTFFDEITSCVVSPRLSDQTRGLELLQQFNEPRETRLGFSEKGIDGHGSAGGIGGDIWTALSTDLKAFVRVGILKPIEDVPLFVENVADDRTSDLTTRIVFEPLARFTESMLAKHPEFTSGRHTTRVVTHRVWEPSKVKWIDTDLVLPVADRNQLVLVPRDWARPRLLMSPHRYFETTMLTFAQEQRTVIDRTTGKPVMPPKWSLKQQKEFARGIDTIVRVTGDAHRVGEDLVERFRTFVDTRYEPLSDDEIARRTY